jgi:endo-1,4-beta-xylanase
MTTTTTRTLLALTVLAAAACGGSDTTAPVVTPAEKTCAQDPSQAKCPTTTPVTTTLKQLATAKGRSVGTALDATFFGANAAAYDTLVAREFNMIVAGNVMKWEPLQRNGRFTYRWTNPDLLVAFGQANGMKIRGHTLAWYQQNPTWLTSTTYSADTLKAILKEHVDSVVGHYKGKIYAWDVVNEALSDGSGALRTAAPWGPVGRDYIDLAFTEARKIDPATLLFYNDYNLETPGAKQDSAFALVSGMKARGVPIDGIGFQAHLLVNANGGGAPTQAQLVSTFQRFAALGLKIHITELDVRIQVPNPTAAALAGQQQAYTDVVAACLAVSACEAIVVWGVNDGESWIPGTFPGWGQALLFDDTLGRKATYTAVRTALGG